MRVYSSRIFLFTLFLASICLAGCFNTSIDGQNKYSFVLLDSVTNDTVLNREVIITNEYKCEHKDLGSCDYSILFRGSSDQFGIVRIPESVFSDNVFVHVSGFSVLGPLKKNNNILSYESKQEKYEINTDEKNLSFSLNQILPKERNIFDFIYQKNFSKKESPEKYEPVKQSYNQDPNCPNGQTGKYRYSQGGWVLVDCKYIPLDFGKTCSSDNECEFNCITTSDDLIYFGCQSVVSACSVSQCYGIKGRCGVYGNEVGHIFQNNRVVTRCIK